MSGPANALVILAVIGYVIARQLRPRRVGGDRWWLIPGLLAVLAVRDGGFIDPHHPGPATALLTAELVVGAAMGVVWATTTRMWTEADGAVWARGTRATVVVWTLGIALRAGLYGIAVAAGIHQGSGSVLFTVAATLLIRTGTLLRRARSLEPSYRTAS
jgi:hypothetical protein